MFKRFSRWISCLLVLAMTLEMFPAVLADALMPHAYASESLASDFGYTVSAPQESSAEVTADIPNVILDKSVDVQVAVPPASSSNDQRYVSLLRTYVLFSQLSQGDAAFFISYTGVSAEIYAELEEHGIDLSASVTLAQLILEYGCTVSQVVALDLSYEEIESQRIQLSIYKKLLRDELAETETDFELRSWILKGYEASQVFNAYGASKVFGTSISVLLEPSTVGTFPASFSDTEVTQIQRFSAALGIESIPVAQYTADHNLTVTELESHQETIDQAKSQIMYATLSTAAEIPDAGNHTPYLSAPYIYSSGEQENVALNTGALVIEAEDYVLPGINGLDLVIGRRYNSQNASAKLPDAKVWMSAIYAYYVVYGWDAQYYVPGIGYGNWSYYSYADIAGPYTSQSEAQQFSDAWSSPGTVRYSDFSDGADLILTYYAKVQPVTAGYENYVYSDTKENNYLNDLYGLGHGWSMLFSSIEFVNSQKYLHLSDGSNYEIDFSTSGSHLKDYTLTDKVIDTNRTEFSNGEATSQYSVGSLS